MKPELALYKKHIMQGRFLTGIDKGMWGNLGKDPEFSSWPFVYLWVSSSSKVGVEKRYCFKFDLTGYSNDAPTACLWDFNENTKLDTIRWPKGDALISSVFRPDWKGGNSLYAPCDREADLRGHVQWKDQYPKYYWQSTFTIVDYLNFLFELLN